MRPEFIALVNRVPYLERGSSQLIDRIAQAVTHQVEEDFAPAWGLQPIPVVPIADGQPVPSRAALVCLVDRIRDVGGAVGRHTMSDAGTITGFVAVESIQRLGGTLTKGHDSVSAALSHEVLELLVNPAVNFWADETPERQVALEVCDPVAGDAYEIELPPDSVGGCERISVSNFVLPSWFNAKATTRKFDHLGLLARPFEHRATGYVIARSEARIAAREGAEIGDAQRERMASTDRFARRPSPEADTGQPVVVSSREA